MCRYAMNGPYKEVFACFACRKSFKQTSKYDLEPGIYETLEPVCPQCGTPMHSMGQDFRAPKQKDAKQWAKVIALYEHGFTYHNCGCGAGYRPAEPRELPAFLEEHASRKRSDGERLLQRLLNG